MKVYCAWCQQEGRPALLREVEPFDDPTETHGICPEHKRQILGQLQEARLGRPEVGGPLVRAGGPSGERPEVDELDAGELRRRITDWIGEGQVVLTQLIPALLDRHDRLRARVDEAERQAEQLRQELTRAQQRLAVLQEENDALRREQEEIVALFRRVMDQTMEQVLQPMYEMLQRLRLKARK